MSPSSNEMWRTMSPANGRAWDGNGESNPMDDRKVVLHTIRAAALACIEAFHEAKRDARAASHNVFLLQDLEDRFMTWAEGSGVFSDDGSSLHPHLRQDENAQDALRQQLASLRRKIARASPVARDDSIHTVATKEKHGSGAEPPPPSSSSSSSSSDAANALSGHSTRLGSLSEVRGAISRLPRLSEAIKDPSNRSQSVVDDGHAVEAGHEPDTDELRNYLKWKFARDFAHQSLSGELQQRIMHGIILRRSRLRSEQGHHDDAPRSVVASPQVNDATSNRREDLDIPGPPEPPNNEAGALCPYCHVAVSDEVLQRSNWMHHVTEDMRPYICIYSDCESPETQYATEEEWEDHMKQHLALTWTCPICAPEVTEFTSEDDLRRHVETSHSENASTTKHSFRPRQHLFSVPSDGNSCCPFCSLSASFVREAADERDAQGEESLSKIIQNHVAGHLEQLAMLSLPAQELDSKASFGSTREDVVEHDHERDQANSEDGYWNNQDYWTSMSGFWSSLQPVPETEADFWITVFTRADDGLVPSYWRAQPDEEAQRDPVLADLLASRKRMISEHPSRPKSADTPNNSRIPSPSEMMTDEDWDLILNQEDKESYSSALQKVDLLINRGYDFPYHRHGKEAIHVAAQGGILSLINHLSSLHIGLDCRDDDGSTVVHYAAKGGHTATVCHFYNLGVDVQTTNRNGWSAMHFAAQAGKTLMIEYLYTIGLDIHAEDLSGRVPLYYAAEAGHAMAVDCLFSLGFDHKGKNGFTAIHYAALSGRNALIDGLRGLGHDVDSRNEGGLTAIHFAAQAGQVETIDHLLSLGLSIQTKDNQGQTAMHHAAAKGQCAVIQHLLMSYSTRGKSVAWADVAVSRPSTAARDNQGRTPFWIAASKGFTEVMKLLLLDAGQVFVDCPDSQGQTPFGIAVYRGFDEMVRLLLEKGRVQVDQREAKSSASRSAPKKRKDSRSRDNPGATALQVACLRGHESIVQLLLDWGADVNAQGGFYGNALQAAAAKGHEQIVQDLLRHGANVDARGGYFGTALKAASSRGHARVEQLLRKDGANSSSERRTTT